MASIDEELRLDDEENAREAQYIHDRLPAELKDKFATDDLLYMMEAIVDYYFSSGVLEQEAGTDGCVDIDLQQVAEYVCHKAGEEGRATYDPEEVFFVAQADLDFQEENS